MNNKRTLQQLCFWALFAVTLPLSAADLIIQLSDESTTRAISEADIKITDRDGNAQSATTNNQGKSRFTGLAPGLYEVFIQRNNYNSVRVPSVRLIEGKTTPMSTSLQPSKTGVEEVLVLGSNISNNWLSSAGASQKDREALRSSAGSGGDVLRALDGMPGLFSDGEFSSYTVRGNGPRDNQILVDGVPFGNVVHFSDSLGELEEAEGGGRYSVFAPNIISKADFQPGGWSAAYGGRAGSLLQLEVAEGNPETRSYTARLDIAGLEVGYDGPTGVINNTSILFSARQLNFGRLFKMVGLEGAGEPELTDIILKTSTQLDNGDSVKLLTIYAPEKYIRDIDHILASDEDEPGNYDNVSLTNHNVDNSLVSISWDKLIGSHGELSNKIYYRVFAENTEIGEAYPDLVSIGSRAEDIPQRSTIITSEHEQTELGWRLDFSYDNTVGRLRSGIRVNQLDINLSLALDDDWNRYEFDSRDTAFTPEQKYIVFTPNAINHRYKQKSNQYALFTEQTLELQDIEVRAGLRFDADDFTEHSEITPRLAATWLIGEKLTINTTAGRYLQSPSIDELGVDARNSQLDYEKIDQATLGFSYRWSENIEAFIEPYYQSIGDRIVRLDSVNQTYANTGEGHSYGVDTALTRHFAMGWSANATYSYNNSVYKDAPDAEEYDADHNRPHAISLGGIWEINARWKLSGRVKWASGRPYGEYIIHNNVLGDNEVLRYSKETISNNTKRHEGYSSINLRIDYRRSLGSTHIVAFIDMINLVGSDNPSKVNFNERTGKIIEDEGSVLPLFGLRFEW